MKDFWVAIGNLWRLWIVAAIIAAGMYVASQAAHIIDHLFNTLLG